MQFSVWRWLSYSAAPPPKENAGVEHQSKDEFMQGLRCRGNKLPVCVERMGKIVDCKCANSVEFDRIFDR